MLQAKEVNNGLPTRRWFVHVGMWSALALLLLSLYGRWLIDATPGALRPAWYVFGPFLWLTDFLNLVLFSQFWFFFLCTVGLSVCGLLMFWGGWRARIVSALILGLVLAAPFAITQIYGQYTLRTVVSAPGYEINWLTQPKGRFSSAFKSAQREHDVTGCRYRIHGWSKNNRLYFGSHCRNDMWMYDAQERGNPRRIQRLPRGFEPVSAVKTWQVRHSGQGGLSVTKVVEESESKDGRTKAFVVQDSFYGPFDVLIMWRDKLD